MDGCRFCEISAGERDAYTVADTEQTVAFLDSNPATVGHTLVAPKPHTEFLFKNGSVAESVFGTVQRTVAAMYRELSPDGISVFYTSGALAGTVTHAHVHLVPRYVDDDISIRLSREDLDDETSTEIARRLQDGF